MKYTFYIVAAALLFTACKKKKDPVNCYICTRNNATTSNVAAYNNPHYETYVDTLCNFNEARINMYMKERTGKDTLAQYGDTLIISNWTDKCIVE